jgi:hypothetical protein|tara:strand:+ start:883 stop:999 length:117 start_codon:yes stop_codon:yes gene_type:complete
MELAYRFACECFLVIDLANLLGYFALVWVVDEPALKKT